MSSYETTYGRPQLFLPKSLKLNRAEALRYAGCDEPSLEGEVRARFDTLSQICEQTLSPSCVYSFFIVDKDKTKSLTDKGCPGVALVGTSLVLVGQDIAAHLAGAEEVALMACTLGPSSEREMRKYTALSQLDALLYGASASALIEAAADATEEAIVLQASARSLYSNMRYSPGYGDFPLSIQPAFLEALDATKRIGLVATDKYLLVPAKSVTAVIGLFSESVASVSADTFCESCCRKETCVLRKKGMTCHGC